MRLDRTKTTTGTRHTGHPSDPDTVRRAGAGPLPPVNPYPLQVPGTGNGMIPPPAAGQYAPQQQAAQPPVTSGNTQNPYANNNR